MRLVVCDSMRSAKTEGEGGSGIEAPYEREVRGVRVVSGGSESELVWFLVYRSNGGHEP